MAAKQLSQERAGHTLQATALVHEAYLRLVGDGARMSWENRRHFFASAGEAMRRILIDFARQKASQKRGGHRQRLELDDLDVGQPNRVEKLFEIDEALSKLEAVEPRMAELVKLRFFAGFSIEEAADALGISVATANRSWVYAKAWLHREMT